ncbi:restriction endonuclease [Archangium lipolyticum]|uniref:restriction endonuclease n=1 Tax=Archangium lipolyticum TaxID=2970465 RepID=UPI00214A674E|nr:restriction endonuclease [Archangium lipolyticum]
MDQQTIDPDWRFRAAAFQAVERLVARHGPILRWEHIAQGFEIDGQHIMFTAKPRGIFRPKQMQGAALSIRAAMPRRSRERECQEQLKKVAFTYKLQGDAPDGYDNHLLLQALDLSAPLIYFLAVEPAAYEPMWPVFVRGIDLSRMECRLSLDERAVVAKESRLLNNPTILEPEFRIQLVEVNRELMELLARHPERLRKLDARKFEQVVAEIFKNQGFDVVLTPQTRDGGRDIQAVRKDSFGTFLYYVECKRYAKSRPVGVEVVRALYGVVQHDRATAGIIATTSSVTDDAIDFATPIKYQLSLRDFEALGEWLGTYRK